MRIVHVTSVHVWQDTRVYFRMCQGLAKAGHEVTLIAQDVPSVLDDGVTGIALPTVRNRFLRALFVAPVAVARASRERADVIHLHDAELLPWTKIFRRRGSPFVFDMHEYLPAAIETKSWIPAPFQRSAAWLWKRLERLLIWRMPTIYAERSYAKYYPWVEKHEVVLNLPAAEALLSEPPATLGNNRIVYVGAVTPGRGSVVTLEAMALLSKRGIEVEFVCIGKISEVHRTELDERKKDLCLKRVITRGFMPQPEAMQLARTASIGLALLQPERNYLESYPTKMFEYMAMGLPVLVSDFPLYRRIVHQTGCGLCVDPTSPAKIADGIEKILSDKEGAARMGRQGREAVKQRFNWSTEQKKLENFYSSIAEGKKR